MLRLFGSDLIIKKEGKNDLGIVVSRFFVEKISEKFVQIRFLYGDIIIFSPKIKINNEEEFNKLKENQLVFNNIEPGNSVYRRYLEIVLAKDNSIKAVRFNTYKSNEYLVDILSDHSQIIDYSLLEVFNTDDGDGMLYLDLVLSSKDWNLNFNIKKIRETFLCEDYEIEDDEYDDDEEEECDEEDNDEFDEEECDDEDEDE